ncbi:MAG: hypothetical protein Fur006_07080 [Coleofasciculaceae cyanobacterium]
MPEIIWTSYLRYRATQRNFDLDLIENILRFSSERYSDVETDRAICCKQQRCALRAPRYANAIAVGKHREQLVLIPYEQNENIITLVTIHATTRQQIRFRLKTGRFITNV